MVGYYYRSLVYFDLFRKKRLKTTCEEAVMAVTVKQFAKDLFEIPDQIVDGRGVERA